MIFGIGRSLLCLVALTVLTSNSISRTYPAIVGISVSSQKVRGYEGVEAQNAFDTMREAPALVRHAPPAPSRCLFHLFISTYVFCSGFFFFWFFLGKTRWGPCTSTCQPGRLGVFRLFSIAPGMLRRESLFGATQSPETIVVLAFGCGIDGRT